MPRPKTDSRWAARVATLAEDGLKPPRITEILEDEARERGRVDSPSERTVRRLYELHNAQPEHVRREQARLHWPQSFVAGALPWEASRAALDLLSYRDQQGLSHPTARQAKWFWRLRLASASMPLDAANTASWTLALLEYLTVSGVAPEMSGGLEWQLAFEPWAGEPEQSAFDAALARHPERSDEFAFRISGTAAEVNAGSATVRSYIATMQAPQGKLTNG